MIKFKLSDKFLTNYEGKQPSWGFGDLSYLVYKRTYSRIMENGQQEEWFDTVKRVVEGCFNIQKDHCEKVGLPWDAYRAQKSAQKMFEKIWEFKFTPPGRGLWICGTSVVEEKGGAALNNCGFFSSEQIGKDFGEPFSWAADMLMLGVGIGYDTRGANKLLIKQPTGKPTTYQIPDTREGWAEAVRLLIDSFDGRSRTPVEFDYTLVRAAGEPIKGFGGTASGPEPLREGLESIRNLLTENDSQYITSVVITDIVNFIGKFVVAGNVRRSATISFSNDTDRDFIEMKDPVKFTKELIDRRWVSNNSVFAGVETDFASLENNINTNGEPGLFFLDNARHYGRFKDGYYPENHPYFDNCIGSNPCVTKDTWVSTSDGPRQVHELLEQKTTFIVNDKEYFGTNFWSTGIKKVFKLTTSEGYSLKLTDNHKLLTTKGWLEAKDLVSGDKLLLNKHKNLSWAGEGTSDEGYLVGSLLGDGTFANGKPILAVWEDGGHESVMNKIEEIMFKLPHRSDFKGFNTIDIATCNVLTHRAILASFKPIANKFGMFQGSKTITTTIEKASSDFYQGFLRGLFDADGSVQGTQKKGISVRLSQVSVSCLEAVQRMLLRLGIKSVIYPRTEEGNRLLPDGKGGQKEYFCQKSYELIIANDCIIDYNQKIGFVNSIKQNKLDTLISLYKRTPNKTLFEATFDQLIPQEDEEVFDATVEDVHRFDANGLVAHNCVEQLLEDRELCTLVETYPARHKNAEEYFETLKYAYLYAKSVTLVPTHSKHTNAVMLKNRRIGVSQSGIQQALKKFGHATYFKRFCDEAYGILRNWDKIYSRWLGIPTSIRVSSIKPSGTVSLLTGSTPGVHCTHSEYYFRTVRMAANSSLLPNLVKANYRIEYAVTDTEKIKNCMSPAELDSTSILIADLSKETMDKFKNIGGTVVIYFPIKEENFTKSKYDISIWEQMSLVRELQHNWADNCVSVTVTIKPEEKKDLVDAIRFFAPYIKALSFLPLDNHGYAQAPYTTCSKEEYEQYKASLKPLTFKKSKAEAKGERFCTTDRCEV